MGEEGAPTFLGIGLHCLVVKTRAAAGRVARANSEKPACNGGGSLGAVLGQLLEKLGRAAKAAGLGQMARSSGSCPTPGVVPFQHRLQKRRASSPAMTMGRPYKAFRNLASVGGGRNSSSGPRVA